MDACNLTSGIYTDISAKEYHKIPYISNSYLSRLAKTPAHALLKQEDTPTLIFGSATHSYILEGPDAFFKEFAVPPKCDRRTKEGKELWSQFQLANIDKDLICEEDFVTITEIDRSVKAHPFAKELLAEGISEQTVIWQDEETGIMCKCRPDRTPDGNKGVLVDLKTTKSADEYSFNKSVVAYGYYRQASMYLEGIRTVTGQRFDAFAFIAVEPEAPYRVEVYILDSDFLEVGHRDFHRLLRVEKECRDNNHWPNFQVRGAQDLLKPPYL